MNEYSQQPDTMILFILGIYAIIPALITIAGIITWIAGSNKQKKNLKLAGIVITIIGGKILLIFGLIYLYMKFLLALTI